MEKTLVFIVKQDKKGAGTWTNYEFVGDKSLKKVMKEYFLEEILKDMRHP